jgi:hypothetical protein
MLASVHLVDGSVRSTVTALLRTPKPGAVAGLRDARTLVAAPLGGTPPSPQLGRHALIAMWDDEAALDAFLATHPYARDLGDGFQARLEPIRAVPIAERTWPGLPPDLPRGLVVDPGGPTAVVTIGKLRVSRAVPFFQASARAERHVVGAPGLLWATGLANVVDRVVSTFSLW